MFNQWLIWNVEFWLTKQQKAYLAKQWEQKTYPVFLVKKVR